MMEKYLTPITVDDAGDHQTIYSDHESVGDGFLTPALLFPCVGFALSMLVVRSGHKS